MKCRICGSPVIWTSDEGGVPYTYCNKCSLEGTERTTVYDDLPGTFEDPQMQRLAVALDLDKIERINKFFRILFWALYVLVLVYGTFQVVRCAIT